MTYRKITVEGKQYRYVIGTKGTKIQAVGDSDFTLHLNSAIGHAIPGMTTFMVEPKDIRNAILNKPVQTRTCKKHGVTTTELTVNPYEAEIHQRTVFMINCRECVREVADDI